MSSKGRIPTSGDDDDDEEKADGDDDGQHSLSSCYKGHEAKMLLCLSSLHSH